MMSTPRFPTSVTSVNGVKVAPDADRITAPSSRVEHKHSLPKELAALIMVSRSPRTSGEANEFLD